MKQTVRIIGGRFRGKKLHFPDLEGLRPTPDRIKETLFNWIMNEIRGALCLDAFAGSGALGFEAFSRGAKQVVLVEASKPAYSNLRQIAASFNSADLEVVNAKAEDYFAQTKASFDIIFLDPPFTQDYLPQCLAFLANSNLLVKGGLIYIESATRQEVDPLHWQERKFKQAGQVCYGLYEKITI
ncbi:MAG: 16S rRNA (guanine(966)-N(2))-methyltransferase RsmD [Tatlockia sp.]|nr:16S rRNA (guanine(966)-N(2))-methyltransferase RsmD [Tatlockia sp.]